MIESLFKRVEVYLGVQLESPSFLFSFTTLYFLFFLAWSCVYKRVNCDKLVFRLKS